MLELRILKRSLNNRAYTLQIDNLDDLWHLYNLIENHDIIGSKTYRRLEKASDKLRPDKTQKRLVWLAIDVEDVEFHEFSNRLRIRGIIIKGPDELGLRAHHTLNFTPGDELELEKLKDWKQHQKDLLEEAVKATGQSRVLVISLEDDNALIAQIYQYGIRSLVTIERSGGGKLYEGTKAGKTQVGSSGQANKEFFNDILLQLNQVRPENTPLLIVGPGFTKDQLISFFRDKKVKDAEKILLETTGQAGMPGIHEAIKRGVVKRLVQDSRVSFEVELIEKLLEGIAMDGAVVYGQVQVENAVAIGAVDHLLVIDKFIRGKNEFIEQLMNNTEKSGGKVVILIIKGSDQSLVKS